MDIHVIGPDDLKLTERCDCDALHEPTKGNPYRVIVTYKFNPLCEQCKGTGICPSPFGRDVLEFMKQYGECP